VAEWLIAPDSKSGGDRPGKHPRRFESYRLRSLFQSEGHNPGRVPGPLSNPTGAKGPVRSIPCGKPLWWSDCRLGAGQTGPGKAEYAHMADSIKDSRDLGHLSLAEAIKAGKLKDFVTQEHARGIGPGEVPQSSKRGNQ
jgi:hypothetical protein